MFWRRRKEITDDLTRDLKSVAEVAGDQISPGAGTYALILGGLAVAAAGAYVLHQRRKSKKAAEGASAPRSAERFAPGRATK
jgi:LPXTG-motif cell wall-anchored protein